MSRKRRSPERSELENVDPRVDRSRKAGLEAARSILLEEGWEAVTHQRVAERSGLGRATLYRHWPQASDLLRDSLAGEALSIRTPTTEDLRTDLINQLKRIRLELFDQGFGRVLAALVDRAEWDVDVQRIKVDVIRAGTKLLRSRIVLAVARGQLGASVDLSRAVSQLAGPIIYRRLVSGERVPPAFLEGIVDDFIRVHRPTRSAKDSRRFR